MLKSNKSQKGQKRKTQEDVFNGNPRRKIQNGAPQKKEFTTVVPNLSPKNEKQTSPMNKKSKPDLSKKSKPNLGQKPKPDLGQKSKPDLGNKYKAQAEMLAQHATRKRKISEVDDKLLAENEHRLRDQKKRTIYVGLPGKLQKTSDSAIKALHPDILNVNRLSHAAFLIFSSEAVRDKAFPVIQKGRINNTPLKVDYCCEKQQKKNTKQHTAGKGLNLGQLVVSDLLGNTTQSMLEIVFPKANDIKIIKSRNTAYVNFNEESDALEAFKKGKGLKISGVPVVVRFRYSDLDKKSRDSENEKPVSGAGDLFNAQTAKKPKLAEEKSKPVKKEVEIAQKAKKMLQSGEIKPTLSKEELAKATPMFDSDDSDEEMDEDMLESGEESFGEDEGEDGFGGLEDSDLEGIESLEDLESDDDIEDSDEGSTFDTKLVVTKKGKPQFKPRK